MDITSYLLGKNASGGGGGGSDLDWTALGYEERPQAIDEGYNYALEIKNNWTPETNLSYKFKDDVNLKFMPLVDTSSTTNMTAMFLRCSSLESVATLNTSNITLANQMFQACTELKTVPLFDLSNCKQLSNMFNTCKYLEDVPQFNISSAIAVYSMFFGCQNLTNESLNNILGMCIGATSYKETKTLAYLGLSNTYYPVERIQALPKYQDFIDAGWTIGY